MSTPFPEAARRLEFRVSSLGFQLVPRATNTWPAEIGALKGSSVAFSPDGKTIASGSADNTVRLQEASTGAQVGEPLEGHSGSVTSVTFSPDGKTIASGNGDKTVRLWDASTGA